MLRVEELNRIEDLALVRAVWRALHRQTPQAAFFQSLEWLETYWRHYGAEQQLRVLVVRDIDDVVGIVPLTMLRESTSLGRMRVLTYPQAYWGSYYGPLGRNPRDALAAALRHLGRSRRNWDLLDLRFAPAAELDVADTERTMHEAGFTPDSRQTDVTSFVDLPSTFDAYLQTRTNKWRTNYRRWLRRLSEQGELRFVRYRPRGAEHADADPRWDLYDACEDVARHSWQGSSTTGTTITHESVRPFLRDMHVTAVAAGAADVNLLYLDDRPTAFLYAYWFAGYLYGLRIGYDESISRHGIGNVLYMHVIADSIARGDRLFDLGPGSVEAKKPICSRTEPIFRRTYGNPLSLRGLLWRSKRAMALGGQFMKKNSAIKPTTATTIDTNQACV